MEGIGFTSSFAEAILESNEGGNDQAVSFGPADQGVNLSGSEHHE